MICPFCKEPFYWHKLLGVEINAEAWHMVFTGKGLSLSPSDSGLSFDEPIVFVPDQRKHVRTTPLGLRGHFAWRDRP
jgi:hypothetical protein